MNDMTNVNDNFKEDLARLERGEGPRVYARWVALARRAVGGTLGQADVEDIVQDLLAVLLELPRRKPETWVKLRTAEELNLKWWLAGRFRWFMLASLPGAPERHALRGMIRAAQKAGLPPAGPQPETIHKGDRLSRSLVGRAVAWAIASGNARACRIDELVSVLWTGWGAELMPIDPPTSLDGEQVARRGIDAFGLARSALTRLDPVDLKILGLYAHGLAYDEIARKVGCAKATVSRRFHAAFESLRGERVVSDATRKLAFDYLLNVCRRRLE
jgi:DNA-directed RNA polymerase specialized sigma24 family protein